MGDGVDVQIEQRVSHRGEVADLTGEVEHDVGVADDLADDVVPDLGDHDLDVDVVDVAAIAAMTFDQRIDDAHGRATPGQLMDEVGADETQPAGHDAHGR